MVDVPALAFESVRFGYGSQPVVQDVTFNIAAGEMVGLLGPNGAGKSTLLRLGSGAIQPQAGAIRLAGEDIHRLSHRALARGLAVAPQEFTVQFAYTVRQIVELGRMPYHDALGLSRRQDSEAIEAAMVAAGVAHLAERVFNDLSGGERQRVLIALTLAQGAPLLLLDEPTAHLDIRYQIEVLELLQRLNAERKLTVLAAMHDLNLASRFFPRLLLFHGVIEADGPPAQVLDAMMLSRVYETPVRVGILRGEQHLSVLPPGQPATVVWQPEQRSTPTAAPVHVLAGGGSGELMMRALADAGIAFSAGPLNIGDSDYALAQQLAALTLVEPPYAPVSPEGLSAAHTRLAEAPASVLCPMPLGSGNVALIEAALAAREAERDVLLLEPGAAATDTDALLAIVASRDFSGRGVALYRRLLAAGCMVVSSPIEVIAVLRERHPEWAMRS